MQILESSFYQIKMYTQPELHLSVNAPKTPAVSPLSVPQLIPNFLEDVTGCDSTWNKKQTSGRLSSVCPVGDWRKLESSPPDPPHSPPPSRSTVNSRDLFNTVLNKGQLSSAAEFGPRTRRILCNCTVQFYFHLFIYGLIYVLFNI